MHPQLVLRSLILAVNKHRIAGRGGANRRPQNQNQENGTVGGWVEAPDKRGDHPREAKATAKAKAVAAAHAAAKAKYDAGMALLPREVAALLGFSRATISAWCNRTHHRLPKVGGKILPAHLDQWLDQEAARQSGGGGADDAQ